MASDRPTHAHRLLAIARLLGLSLVVGYAIELALAPLVDGLDPIPSSRLELVVLGGLTTIVAALALASAGSRIHEVEQHRAVRSTAAQVEAEHNAETEGDRLRTDAAVSPARSAELCAPGQARRPDQM